MNARDPEWIRYAVLEYVRLWRDYEHRKSFRLGRIAEMEVMLEGLGAVRYDRDGSPSGYVDRRPELLDTIQEMHDALMGDIEREEEDYQRALDLFSENEESLIVWEKYGLRMTWAGVGRQHLMSERTAKRAAERGFRHIFDNMPPQYRRVPVAAEEWKR